MPELKRCSLGRGRPLRCPTARTSWAHREWGCCRGLGSQGKPATHELPWGARRSHRGGGGAAYAGILTVHDRTVNILWVKRACPCPRRGQEAKRAGPELN